MKYKNTKTGAIVDVKSIIGGDWVPVEEPKKPTEDAPKKTVKRAK